MKDSYGRDVSYLRISVTDRCNFRCRYCMPFEGVPAARHDEILSFDDIVRIAKTANELGIRAFRITGGEPLVRRGLPDLIRALRDHCEIDDLSMTTNAFLLPRFARELKDAGLDRVNISIDSLDPEKFSWIARGGDLETVLRGLDTALEVGFDPIKTNTVVMGGFNDDEIIDLIDYLTIDKPISARFIEYMPIGEAPRAGLEYVDLTAKREELTAKYGLEPAEISRGHGPASYWRAQGGAGLVGFITPISDKYCGTCSRLRLDARGVVRPCIAYDFGVSLRDALHDGGTERVRELIEGIILNKPKEHHWETGEVSPVAMSALGG